MNCDEVFEALKYRRVIDEFGNVQYFNSSGEFHRENGPASVDQFGNQYWMQNDQLHRVGGPAVLYTTGFQEWYINGKLHRTDGPAVIFPDGRRRWYINDVELTEEAFNAQVSNEQ